MKPKKQTEVVQENPQADLLRVEAYSFFEFCQKVQQAINDGYRFDFDSNENFPQIYGSYLTCGMVSGMVSGMVR